MIEMTIMAGNIECLLYSRVCDQPHNISCFSFSVSNHCILCILISILQITFSFIISVVASSCPSKFTLCGCPLCFGLSEVNIYELHHWVPLLSGFLSSLANSGHQIREGEVGILIPLAPNLYGHFRLAPSSLDNCRSFNSSF